MQSYNGFLKKKKKNLGVNYQLVGKELAENSEPKMLF